MLPQPWNPHSVTPALMTSDEYLNYCNKNDEWHEDHAYNYDLAKLNPEWSKSSKRTEYRHVRSFKKNGIDFELMVATRKSNYAMRDTNNEYVRIDGEIQYYTDEEVKRLGYQPEELSFAIFDGETRVAAAQDEWGCMLIMVAKEYRQFGLGTIIGKIARTYEPGKTSGGFTPSGAKNFIRVHREFVRDALASGFYSSMVKQGGLTIERAREIVLSAKVQKRPAKSEVDYASNDPKTWVLFADEHGSFILYDRKLANVIDQGDQAEHFLDRMIKGYVYAMPHESAGVTRIKQFGADNPKLKAFMLSLAYTNAKRDGLPLYVEPSEYNLTGFQYGDEDNRVGYSSREVLSGPVVNYAGMAEQERRWRASFDQYHEFEYRVQEMAHAKYSG